MFNITNKKINKINGGYIEDAEDGHTYISTVNSNKNININGNEIILKSKKLCFNNICLTSDDFKNIKKINNISTDLNNKLTNLNNKINNISDLNFEKTNLGNCTYGDMKIGSDYYKVSNTTSKNNCIQSCLKDKNCRGFIYGVSGRRCGSSGTARESDNCRCYKINVGLDRIKPVSEGGVCKDNGDYTFYKKIMN